MKAGFFNKLPIRSRISALLALSITLALALSASGLVFFEWAAFRRQAAGDLRALSRVLAVGLRAPDGRLTSEQAGGVLKSLRDAEDIVAAHVYTVESGGVQLAQSYYRDGAAIRPPLPPGDGVSFAGGRARWVETIRNERGPPIRLDLHSDLGSLRRELRRHLLIMGGGMVALLAVGVWSVTRLRKSITRPLIAVADTAREIAERKDYSLRARVSGDNEISRFATHFNRMLDAIEQRGRALNESESRFRSVWERSADGMILTDAEGVILEVNPAFCRMTGLAAPALVRTPFVQHVSSPDPGLFFRRYRRRFSKRSFPPLLAERLAFVGGKTADVEMSISFVDLGVQGVVLLTMFRDITERKQADEQLRMLSQAIQQSPAAVMITTPGGEIQFVNRKFIELTGYSWEEVYGKNPRILNSGHTPLELHQSLWEAIRNDRRWTGEMRDRRKDGSLFWARVTVAPIKNTSGKSAHILADMENISERRQAEEDRAALEAQLRQAQKMEALGTLAGGIAHDFNNILAAIIGYTELAQMDAKNSPEIMESLQQVLAGSNRARDLVRQILAFSRRSKQERKPLRLQPIVEEVIKLLRSTLPASIEILSMIEEDAPGVFADPTQIHQVFMNLGANAAHAMRGKPGRLSMGVGRTRLDEESSRIRPGLRPGLYARLFVSDTGHGMDGETIKRIFDPFFTTKAPGEGTGLGLAVVDGIIRDHDGAILVESQPGVGSTFQILLPAHQAEAEEKKTVAEDVSPGLGQHILLVDDEPALCRTCQRVLDRFGYRVTTHVRPAEALGLFRANSGDFDLVITDFSMPGMSGLEMAAEMLKIRPNMPILLTSGFLGPQTTELAAQIGVREVASKPISPSRLGQIIGRMLAEEARRAGAEPPN